MIQARDTGTLWTNDTDERHGHTLNERHRRETRDTLWTNDTDERHRTHFERTTQTRDTGTLWTNDTDERHGHTLNKRHRRETRIHFERTTQTRDTGTLWTNDRDEGDRELWMLRGKRCRLTQSHFEDLVCSLFESDASVAWFTANREFYRCFLLLLLSSTTGQHHRPNT